MKARIIASGLSMEAEIVDLARQRGHEILYTPPHHSDLQPIETVWAIVKTSVGNQYSTETSFVDVGTRLQTAFKNLTSEQVVGCIRKARAWEDEFRLRIEEDEEKLKEMENAREDSSTEESSESDSDDEMSTCE